MNPNDNNTGILSIVIPTRNRYECITSCLQAARLAAPSAQILIADSSDGDELEDFINNLKESPARLKYIRTSPHSNVVENFEAALTHCTGEYIIYIGDDDLVGPEIERVAEWALSQNIDALVPYGNKFGVAYYWPGVKSKYFGNEYSGKVFVWSITSKFKLINPLREIRRAERSVGRGLALLPRIYHGMVRKKTLVEVETRFKSLFGGVSPDIYSAVLIARVAQRVVYLDYPFFVPGASPRSEAGSGAAQTDRISFEESPYLKRFKNLKWDALIPKFFSPYTVWGYSLVEGMKIGGFEISVITYCRIYARCLIYCSSYRREVFISMRTAKHQFGSTALGAAMILALAEEGWHFLSHLMPKLLRPRAGGWAKRYSGIENSVEAFQFVQKMAGKFTPSI